MYYDNNSEDSLIMARCGVLKHVAELIPCEEYLQCMYSWLHKLLVKRSSVHTVLEVSLKVSGVHHHLSQLDLINLFRPRLIISSKVFQVFIHCSINQHYVWHPSGTFQLALFLFFVLWIVIQLCNVNQHNALFKLVF